MDDLNYFKESIEQLHFRLQFKRFMFQVWAYGLEASRLDVSASEHFILKMMLETDEVKSYIFEHMYENESILDVINRIKTYS